MAFKITTLTLFVEKVNGRMKQKCERCEGEPKLKRLVAKRGAGRFVKTRVFCLGCADHVLSDIIEAIRDMQREVEDEEGK